MTNVNAKKATQQNTHLSSGPILDWFYIHAGYLNQGKVWDAPQGIELVVQPARKSEAIILPDQPWENDIVDRVSGLYFKNGKYTLYYQANRSYLCMAESDDGFNWTKPNLGLHEFEGSKENNIIPNGEGSMFEDPSASPEERFKAIGSFGGMFKPDLDSEGRPVDFKSSKTAMDLIGTTNSEASTKDILELQEYLKEKYDDEWAQLKMFLYPLVSPDGLRWTELKKHLMLGEWVDGDKIAHYDEDLQKYIAYLRFHTAGRRCVGRSESDDFRTLTPEKAVLRIDSQDPPDSSIYHHSYTLYPGRDDIHLMFPSIYHQTTGHLDVQLAISHDGLDWDRPDRTNPIIPNGPEGSGDSGMIFACPQLLFLPDGQMALAYSGTGRLHQHGDLPHPGIQQIIRYAIWDKDRLAGIRAKEHGRVTLRQEIYRPSENCPDSIEAPPFNSFPPVGDPNEQARQLKLNFKTDIGGWIRVELIPVVGPMTHPEFHAIKGYAFEDCDTLVGDEIDKVVTWKGKENIAALSDTLAIRIEIHRATIFSWEL